MLFYFLCGNWPPVGEPVAFLRGKTNTGMKNTVRVALDFATYKVDQLNSFAILVIVCLKSNPLFPTLPVQITDLTTLQMAYQSAMSAATVGGPKDTSARVEARDPLLMALRQTAAYIQSLGLTESQVLTSGFDVVVWNNSTITLTAPVVSSLDNSVSTQLEVHFKAVNGAKAYQVQYSTGTADMGGYGHLAEHEGRHPPEPHAGNGLYLAHPRHRRSMKYGPWGISSSMMSM